MRPRTTLIRFERDRLGPNDLGLDALQRHAHPRVGSPRIGIHLTQTDLVVDRIEVRVTVRIRHGVPEQHSFLPYPPVLCTQPRLVGPYRLGETTSGHLRPVDRAGHVQLACTVEVGIAPVVDPDRVGRMRSDELEGLHLVTIRHPVVIRVPAGRTRAYLVLLVVSQAVAVGVHTDRLGAEHVLLGVLQAVAVVVTKTIPVQITEVADLPVVVHAVAVGIDVGHVHERRLGTDVLARGGHGRAPTVGQAHGVAPTGDRAVRDARDLVKCGEVLRVPASVVKAEVADQPPTLGFGQGVGR